jgi:hypothetical protein
MLNFNFKSFCGVFIGSLMIIALYEPKHVWTK